jgi:hypothetical protein
VVLKDSYSFIPGVNIEDPNVVIEVVLEILVDATPNLFG